MACPKLTTIHRDRYIVRKLPATPFPFETHALTFKCSVTLTWVLWAFYIVVNCLWVVIYQRSRPGHTAWQRCVTLVFEILLDFPSAVLAFSIALGLFSVSDAGPRPRYLLQGDDAPEIDVLVTCCGEPVGVVINTAAAAATQDYPAGKLRVFVLDDGRDNNLRLAIGEVNLKLANRSSDVAPILYASRKIEHGEHSHFKSGNLRFGIKKSQSTSLKQENGHIKDDQSSGFIAALDADMIPKRDWLRRMVPHLLLDDGMGLACPPQNYYNIPKTPSDTLGQQADFDVYFSVQEPLNDRLGAAMCTGSGYVARRSAIESIGGWPLADCGEDYMCSAMLSDRGWRIAFVSRIFSPVTPALAHPVRENLQSGLAPADLKTLVKQRIRWVSYLPSQLWSSLLVTTATPVQTDAGIEVHQRLGYYLPGRSAIASRMTPGQRVVNMLYVLRDFSPLGITLAMIALPLAFLFVPPYDLTDPGNEPTVSPSWLRRITIIVWIAQKINTWILYRHLGLARVMNFQSQEIWTAPYSAYRCLTALLPGNLSPPTFAVCGATVSPLNERSRQHRKPLFTRLCSADIVLYMLYTCYAAAPLLMLFLSPAASNTNPHAPHAVSALYLFPGSAARLVSLVAKMSTPVRYMIWPPDIPEWRELVAEDGDGVKRPAGVLGGENGLASGAGMWWMFVWGCEFAVLWGGWGAGGSLESGRRGREL